MSQSNVIAGALALAFLLYITVKGELGKYLNLFKYKKHVTPPTQSSGGGGGFGSLLSDFTGIDLSGGLTQSATSVLGSFTPFHSLGTVTNVLQQIGGSSKQSAGAGSPMPIDLGSYTSPSSLGFSGDMSTWFSGTGG